ncbi:hypothetical protein H5410_044891 [Solanum commersonii]|uniref:Uncharacterized protein n=1 Tax=Solanum commersonii TaxID=4109 RepID=A0A9J5X823_SOLCO|nr:hypothetical protein H5410_044891 [Solanum commersonii]
MQDHVGVQQIEWDEIPFIPSLHCGIKNTPVIPRDHKYLQELTTQIFSDVASHMGLIPPRKYCQLGFTTK